MKKVKKLTEKEHWDEVWQNQKLPQVIKEPYCPYYVNILDGFFHKYLFYNENFEFLELGCAPGRWLHYFHKEFGYQVSGLDNSPIGFEMTKKNLKILNVEADVYFGDVLNYQFNTKFDIVFSMGLIEHFNPPGEIVERHFQLVRQGGYLVIGVPNIKKALYVVFQKLINKKNLAGYIHISDKELSAIFSNKKVKIIFCGYVGVFNLYLLDIPPEKKFFYKFIYLAQRLMDKLLRIFRIKSESHLFSPYIFIIVQKI